MIGLHWTILQSLLKASLPRPVATGTAFDNLSTRSQKLLLRSPVGQDGPVCHCCM